MYKDTHLNCIICLFGLLQCDKLNFTNYFTVAYIQYQKQTFTMYSKIVTILIYYTQNVK